jgi:hypothetical protein
MKTIVLLSALIFSSSVFADSQARIDSGLSCSMSYSTSGPLSTAKDSTGGWLISGNELAGTAVVTDGDGEYTATTPAHYLSVSKAKNIWTVSILGGEKSFISAFSFLEKEGMKVVVPVRAWADESEDPAEYDTLEVSCVFTHFAG